LPRATRSVAAIQDILCLITLVNRGNLALIKIKQRDPQPAGVRVFSPWLPGAGFVTAITFLFFELLSKFF
jgi:hypothetical protein